MTIFPAFFESHFQMNSEYSLNELQSNYIISEYISLREEIIFHLQHMYEVVKNTTLLVLVLNSVAIFGGVDIGKGSIQIGLFSSNLKYMSIIALIVSFIGFFYYRNTLRIVILIGSYMWTVEKNVFRENCSDYGWSIFIGQDESKFDSINLWRNIFWFFLISANFIISCAAIFYTTTVH